MAYQPWDQGSTLPPLQYPVTNDSGNEDLTGVATTNIKLIMRNMSASPPTDTTGTGTVKITSVNPGAFTYQFSDTDVSIAGTFQFVFEITFPAGTPVGGLLGGKKRYDPFSFTISPV